MDRISLIVHRPGHHPRHFEVGRGTVRLLLYGLPGVSLLCLLSLGAVLLHFKRIRALAARERPAIIARMREESSRLSDRIGELEGERDALTRKLSRGIDPDASLNPLQLFKRSAGRRDLTKSPELAVEDVEAALRDGKLEVNFRIVNSSRSGRRISGHVFLIMKTGGSVQVWPPNSFGDKEMQIGFDRGELFSTSRFRPVRVLLPLPERKEALFKIIIFNRTGDLIFKKVLLREIGG